MNYSNIRPLFSPAAKDNAKSNTANCEVRRRLVQLANAIKDDAYAQIDSAKLILKFSNELKILRLKSEMEGLL